MGAADHLCVLQQHGRVDLVDGVGVGVVNAEVVGVPPASTAMNNEHNSNSAITTIMCKGPVRVQPQQEAGHSALGQGPHVHADQTVVCTPCAWISDVMFT